jgi:hypothetical protein
MKRFFDPVVNTIAKLVENQLDADSKLSRDGTIKVRDFRVDES